MNSQEAIRRRGKNLKLRAFFAERPGQWINARDLEPIAGRQAWRTRVSELRRQLLAEGAGTIENRQFSIRRIDLEGYIAAIIRSEYRYVPSSRLSAGPRTAAPQDTTLPFLTSQESRSR